VDDVPLRPLRSGRVQSVEQGPRSAITKRGAEALLEANPGLAELATLPEGTPVAVPEIEGAEPQEPRDVRAADRLSGATAMRCSVGPAGVYP
jgi:phage tail protein X